MKSYGQFCPVAKACELLCERWTLLVVRELGCGSRHFNDLRRGVPRMSPALLVRRPGVRGGGRSRDQLVRHVRATVGGDFSTRVKAKSEPR